MCTDSDSHKQSSHVHYGCGGSYALARSLTSSSELVRYRSALAPYRALELKCQSWNDSGIWYFEE